MNVQRIDHTYNVIYAQVTNDKKLDILHFIDNYKLNPFS